MKKNLSLLFMFFCMAVNFSFAKEDGEFIKMPQELSTQILRTVYEDSLLKIGDNEGFVSKQEFLKGEDKGIKKIWLGSPIKEVNGKLKKLKIFFRPDKLRKIGDTYLNPFTLEFDVSKRYESWINHSYLKPIYLEFSKTSSTSRMIRGYNKSDMVVFIPKQVRDNSVKSMLICPRSNLKPTWSRDTVLEDNGYVIEKIQFEYEGNAKTYFTTGASAKGRGELSIITTDNVTPSHMDYDKSLGKDPSVDLTYFADASKVSEVQNDKDIIGGLRFLFNLQSQGGQRRVSEYTYYTWIKKEYIDLPLATIARINDEKVKLKLASGNCYSIVTNAKVLNTTYSKEKFEE